MTTISTRAIPRRLPPVFARILALSGFALIALSASASAQQAPAAPAANPAAAPAVTRSQLAPVAPSAAAPAATPSAAAPVAPAAPTRDATSSIERNAAQAANPPAAAKIDTPPARKESPAGYMKRVGNDLLLASRAGSVSQIAMVLSANADVQSIGLNALGDYARSLPKTDRPMYYSGMVNFIARYAAKEAPKYPIARFIVTAQSQDDARGTYVDSHITLASGDAYDVRWLVVKREGVYKVRDAQVIGFWMTSFLDNLFQNYISENGGNPKSLVVALNH
jgi:phospholipid transport system substrate-binding protein